MLALRIVRPLIVAAAVLAATQAVCAAEEHASAHGAHAEEAAAENPNPLIFDPDLAIFSAIVFLILLFVLGKFAWPQIAAALDERERNIANQIAAAEAKHEEAKQLLADYDAKLAAAAGEVRAMLEEARRDAEHTKGQIVEEGRKAANDELNRALREIGRAKEGAIQELAEKTARTAIDLAQTVVDGKLTADEQKSLVRNALSKLTTTVPSKN